MHFFCTVHSSHSHVLLPEICGGKLTSWPPPPLPPTSQGRFLHQKWFGDAPPYRKSSKICFPLFVCYFEAKVGTRCLLECSLSFRIENILRGYHVYKAVWSSCIGKEQLVQCEADNIQNDLASCCCLEKKGMIFPHLPREISRVCCYLLQKVANTSTG